MPTNTISGGSQTDRYLLHKLSVDHASEAHAISSMPEIGWENTAEHWEDDIKSSQGLAFGITLHQPSINRRSLIATVVGVIFKEKTRIMDVLVNPSHWRRGCGKILFNRLMNAMPKDAFLELEASAMGKGLYEQFGFTSDYEVSSFYKQTSEAVDDVPQVEDFSEDDLKEIAALDTAACGMSREQQIKKISEIAKNHILVDKRDDHVQGFLIYTKCNQGVRIGPWVHQNSEDSAKFFKRAFKVISLAYPSTSLAVHTSNRVAMDILNAEGFKKADFTTYHMHKGDNASVKQNRDLYYSIWSFGYG